jgi:hypothetical protein
MWKQINVGFVSGLAAATLLAWGCDRPATPSSPKPSFWTGGSGNCTAGEKFTGGGRIDPPVGKTTFGFNVNARDFCENDGSIRGQLQAVHHPSHTRIHSLTIDQFFSFPDEDRGGQCAAFGGTARIKEGNGSWVQEQFAAVACDNGEPGSSRGGGPDRFGISLEDKRATGTADLTGGNIQAH